MSEPWRYRSGDWYIICDVCGNKILASDSKHRWDGLIVCRHDYETRHPQDFVRTPVDKINVPFTRPPPEDQFQYIAYRTLYVVDGYFVGTSPPYVEG